MLTTQKAVTIALIQAAVIIGGILASSIGYHAAGGSVDFVRTPTSFLVQFGLLLLALPLAWFLVVARLRNRLNSSPLQKTLALGSGIILIIALALFSAFAAGAPWIGSTQWLQDG